MEKLVIGREIDFTKTDLFEVPLLFDSPFLIVRIDATSGYVSSIGKLWVFPFLPGFGFARSQLVEIGAGLNIVESPKVVRLYKIALQPYSKIEQVSLKIWETDLLF